MVSGRSIYSWVVKTGSENRSTESKQLIWVKNTVKNDISFTLRIEKRHVVCPKDCCHTRAKRHIVFSDLSCHLHSRNDMSFARYYSVVFLQEKDTSFGTSKCKHKTQ